MAQQSFSSQKELPKLLGIFSQSTTQATAYDEREKQLQSCIDELSKPHESGIHAEIERMMMELSLSLPSQYVQAKIDILTHLQSFPDTRYARLVEKLSGLKHHRCKVKGNFKRVHYIKVVDLSDIQQAIKEVGE